MSLLPPGRFRQGLVVGKFAPLHLGHEHVLQEALAACDAVSVVSWARPEPPGCEAPRREHWLSLRFPQTRRIVLPPGFPGIPSDAEPDSVHRAFVARLCRMHGLEPDAVFTSEDYGEGFARELGTHLGRPVAHMMVDRARARIPISGTRIRADVHRHRAFLHPQVYASFVERVAILGGESTGKSTLGQALARRCGTLFVAEYGRELWERQGGHLSYEDLLLIGRTQVEREERACLDAHRFLFCDTSPLTTLYYSLAWWGRAEPELEALSRRLYARTVLCEPDIPFVQDGTRQDPAFRDHQHAWYQAQLAQRGVAYLRVGGSLKARVGAYFRYVDPLSQP